MEIVAGTAGHIDHGKTALIKALTGVDADRLPEEKQRGITIDLGFADLKLGDLHIGFVDVPGHERFIKNMLAGASGIDFVLLVVAADEGVMPQTREHFEICRLLGIARGITVLTKSDLVDDELLSLVRLEVGELTANSFLADAPMIAVSSRTGQGIAELRSALEVVARKATRRDSEQIARMPIDRSFSIKGFGTVVTGTLASGTIEDRQELEVLPGGALGRVRGLQTHGTPVQKATSGMRAAVNLGGIDLTDIGRGMTLAERGVLRPSQIFDTELELLKSPGRPLRTRQRVRVHIGTSEVLARVFVINFEGEITPGRSDLVQLRLETPSVVVPDQRFILRSYSPQQTIGGGRILDALADKHRLRDIGNVRRYLISLDKAGTDRAKRLSLLLDHMGQKGCTMDDIRARTAWRREIAEQTVDACLEQYLIVDADGTYISQAAFEALEAMTLVEIKQQHDREPLAKGIPKETLRKRIFSRLSPAIFKELISNLERNDRIVADRDSLRLTDHEVSLEADQAAAREHLRDIFATAGLQVPSLAEALAQTATESKLGHEQVRKIFQLFLDSGEILKINEEFYFSRDTIEVLALRMRSYADGSPGRSIDVPAFKQLAGVSRKYAIPLLEYFDREKITQRVGEKRIIR